MWKLKKISNIRCAATLTKSFIISLFVSDVCVLCSVYATRSWLVFVSTVCSLTVSKQFSNFVWCLIVMWWSTSAAINTNNVLDVHNHTHDAERHRDADIDRDTALNLQKNKFLIRIPSRLAERIVKIRLFLSDSNLLIMCYTQRDTIVIRWCECCYGGYIEWHE